MAWARRFMALAAVSGGICIVPHGDDAVAGVTRAQRTASCASCHRLDGGDIGMAPIAGMEEARIVRSMLAYRAGARKNQIMQVVAGALSEQEIAAVAHDLAGLHAAAAR